MNHREIDCPVCKSSLCELDGDVRTDDPSRVVYLVIYKHKHGDDYAVARTEADAYRIGASWAYEDVVVEDRYGDDYPDLKELATTQPEDGTDEDYLQADKAFLARYQECEDNTFGTNRIEIEAKELVG